VKQHLFGLLALFTLFSTAQARSSREQIWVPDSNLLLASGVAFDHVRVIDARDTRTHIGWIKTGSMYKYSSLTTADSLHLVIGRYATKLAQVARHRQGELVVVLRSFWLEDKKATEEIGTAHLRADLFRSNGTPDYRHVRSLDTFYETKNGWDVTAAVKRMGSTSIADMLYAGSENPLSEETYSLAELSGRQTAALDRWPVYTTENPPKGVYRTVDDFLNLRRSDSTFIVKLGEPLRGEAEYTFHYKNTDGRRGDEITMSDCFALYDGRMWHLAHREGFSRMPQQAREFYALQPLRGLIDESSANAMHGGFLGGLIANADQSKHYTWYVTRFDPEYRRFVPVKRSR